MTTRLLIILMTACAGLGSCAPEGSDAPDEDSGVHDDAFYSSIRANTVLDAPGQTGDGYGDPEHAIDGVHGAPDGNGNTDDVYSLGYEVGVNNYLVLGWDGMVATNGPGTDLAVFENGFEIGGGPNCFMDQLIVSVSLDGENWADFPSDYTATDELVYSSLPDDWPGFAGVFPVLLNETTNPVDPFDPVVAGGDHFDLDDLGDDPISAAIKATGFRLVRLTTAPSVINPDTDATYPQDIISDGADIDGVMARYLEEE